MSYSDISLLLHCDGSNNGTVFTDSSNTPLTVTVNGNACTKTAQSKFGGSSGYFDGAGDFLTVATNSALQFGAGDFTVEAWVYPTTSTGTRCIAAGQADLATAAGSSWVFYISPTATSDVYIGSTSKSVSSPNPAANAWSHIAFVRYGNNLTSYLNGVPVGTTTLTAGSAVNTGATTHKFSIGAFDTGGNPYTGYLDEVCITKGVAVYTGAFPPPTAPYSAASPFAATAIAGQKHLSGQTPAVALGWAGGTPAGAVKNLLGLTPGFSVDSYRGTPAQAIHALSGQVPAIASGFAATATVEQKHLAGQTPAVALGNAETPASAVKNLLGLSPGFSGYFIKARIELPYGDAMQTRVDYVYGDTVEFRCDITYGDIIYSRLEVPYSLLPTVNVLVRCDLPYDDFATLSYRCEFVYGDFAMLSDRCEFVYSLNAEVNVRCEFAYDLDATHKISGRCEFLYSLPADSAGQVSAASFILRTQHG